MRHGHGLGGRGAWAGLGPGPRALTRATSQWRPGSQSGWPGLLKPYDSSALFATRPEWHYRYAEAPRRPRLAAAAAGASVQLYRTICTMHRLRLLSRFRHTSTSTRIVRSFVTLQSDVSRQFFKSLLLAFYFDGHQKT